MIPWLNYVFFEKSEVQTNIWPVLSREIWREPSSMRSFLLCESSRHEWSSPSSCLLFAIVPHMGVLRHQAVIIFPNVKQQKLQLIFPPFGFWFSLSGIYIGGKHISLHKSLPIPRSGLWHWRRREPVSNTEKPLSSQAPTPADSPADTHSLQEPKTSSCRNEDGGPRATEASLWGPSAVVTVVLVLFNRGRKM